MRVWSHVAVILSLGIAFTLGAMLQARLNPKSSVPDYIPFSLTALGNDTISLNGILKLNSSVRADFATSYLKLWRLPASESSGRLHIEPSFEFVGPEDPDRQICTDLRVLDRNGRLLYHDWELSGDGRIGPAEVNISGFSAIRSRLSAPSFKVPAEFASQLDHVDIRFRELSSQQLRHFPRQPHECDPRLTEPNVDGEFEISFTNPVGRRPIESDRLVAFECVVYDDKKQVVRTDFRVANLLPDGERYRFKVKVEPEYYDYSRAGLGFFLPKHGHSEEWLLTHLSAEWGVGYSGCSDGGHLLELPLVGAVAFDDLPSPAQAR